VVRADPADSGEEDTSMVPNTDHRRFEILKPNQPRQGFQVLPSRWVVERTFGWLNHFRRSRGDSERPPQTSQTFIEVAMISIRWRRLA
jgi:putative transposase